MRVRLIAVGERMPAWVEAGFKEYAKRLRGELSLSLHEVRAARRGRDADVQRWKTEEAQRLRAACAPGALRIALDERGACPSTADLAARMGDWFREGREINLLVGGPDGLDAGLVAEADWCWSLSPLTFPHPLVRVILAEQLYRAFSLLKGHPYHRA